MVAILGLFKALTLTNKPRLLLNIPKSYHAVGNLNIKWPYGTEGAIMIDRYGIISQTPH